MYQQGNRKKRARTRRKGEGGEKRHTYLVDELLYPLAQLIHLALGALDGRERRIDAVRCGAPHVVDEIGKVLWVLELDPPVRDRCGGVHPGSRGGRDLRERVLPGSVVEGYFRYDGLV